MAEALPKEVRAARAFLYQRGMTSQQIQPRKFAGAAKELSLSFKELLRLIGIMLEQGQNRASQVSQQVDAEMLRQSEVPLVPNRRLS